MDFRVNEDGIVVSFEYDPNIVQRIREVTGRQFNSFDKTWSIPFFALESLKSQFNVPQKIIDQIHQKQAERLELLKSHDNLKHPLRNFQIEGVSFLADRKKAFLCADMGLGKTCMSISFAELLFDAGKIQRTFIIVPKSLIQHWVNELKKFTENPTILVIKGTKSQRVKQWVMAHEYKYVITNYEQVRDLYNFEQFQHYLKFPSFIILDEATRIKSRKAQLSRRIKQLNAPYKMVLSGRPLENKPEELFSINEFLKNSVLGSWSQFRNKYIVEDFWGNPSYYVNLDDLSTRIKTILFRCRKKDVLTELPDRIDKNYYIELSRAEKVDYNTVTSEIMEAIAIFNEKRGKTYHNVLGCMALAKMYCDHPDLIRQSKSRTAKILDIKSKEGSKYNEFFNIIDEISDKVVIFTQYSKMAEKLYQGLKNSGYSTSLITGDTKDKEKVLWEFQNETQFLVATDVIGYGINLQFATYIINYDLPWNPAVVEQRIARLHRMGQKNAVQVINLIVEDEDKIEQKIRKILGYKQDLFEQILGE